MTQDATLGDTSGGRLPVWETRLRAVRVFIDNNDCVPGMRPAFDDDERGLAEWVKQQRHAGKVGALTPAKYVALIATPGWVWNDETSNRRLFQDRFLVFAAIVGRAGTSDTTEYPSPAEVGFDVRDWLLRQRRHHRTQSLRPEAAALFEALLDWSWDLDDQRRRRCLRELANLATDCTDADALDAAVAASPGDLSQWVAEQRARRGELTAAQAESLERIPQWAWDDRKARGRAHLLRCLDVARLRGLLTPRDEELADARLTPGKSLAALAPGEGVSAARIGQKWAVTRAKAMSPVNVAMTRQLGALESQLGRSLSPAELTALVALSGQALSLLAELSVDAPALRLALADQVLLCEQILQGRTHHTVTPCTAAAPAPDCSVHLPPADRQISALGFSVRTSNCLTRAGIATIDDLLLFAPENLADLRNFGVLSLEEVRFSITGLDELLPAHWERTRLPDALAG